MATLATSYLNARNEISGADTTNMPDSRLLAPANSAYLIIFESDSPRIVQKDASTGGWRLFISNRVSVSGATNFARVANVRYEADNSASTTGTPIHLFKSKDEYDLEVATYPGTAGIPRAGYIERAEITQCWVLHVHPEPDSSEYYLSIEGEIEPAALTGGVSPLLISPANITRLEMLLAHWIGVRLGAPQEVLDSLLGRVGDAKIVAQWLGREESRGEPVKGEARGRP